jgi:threonine 3-dehydrogenase
LFRCATIRSIHGRKIFHTWEESEKLMKEKVDATQVITHDYPMSEYEAAFDALISGKAIKVLINPQQF